MSKKVRIGVVVAALTALAGSSAFLLAARAATDESAAVPKTFSASAALKATAGSGRGTFTGRLTTVNATSGNLSWKATYKSLTSPVTGIQLRRGSKVLARLCTGKCATGSHKVTLLHGAAYRALHDSKATVTFATKLHPTGELKGLVKVKSSAVSSGGGLTAPVTAATIAAGKKLTDHYSCEGCHSINGTKSTGPTWKGLAGSKQTLTNGTTVIATDAYLIGIITDPSSAKVEGYDSGVMAEAIPPGEVSVAEAKDIVAYIKSLK